MLVVEGRYRNFYLRWQDILHLYMYIIVVFVLLESLPNGIWDPLTAQAIVVIGTIGLWRYGWWFINFMRSQYFGNIKFPKMRARANNLWESGWRPSHLHFMITTFYEKPETTKKFLEAIVREVKLTGVPSTLWVGLGSKFDQDVISKWFEPISKDVPLDVVLVKQNLPGKRVAIGLTLRALSRRGIGKDDIAFFMDGDSIMTENVVRKCVSILGAHPHISALTTDEDVVCFGPKWVEKWLRLRFAQRRLWMQSHAVSDKVITLTGRMSAYRASAIVDKEFIRNVEADHLDHWFWGNFRFLSGDDKSTWYTLLKQGGNMTYVPDAMVYTIEYIEGNGYLRSRDNLTRWSGNMLRNGMRAIFLGPKKVNPYIWWCLVDQRVSIWTMLAGFFTSMCIAIFVNPAFIFTYVLWIMITRFLVSCMLFLYSDRIHVSYPPLLYANQILAAFIKVYIMFRLPMQKWANRMAQKAGDDLAANPFMRYFATYMNIFAVTLLTFVVLLFSGILQWPDILQVF